MTIHEQVRNIRTREDFVSFVTALSQHARTKPDWWTNCELGAYLESMSAWATDVEEFEGMSIEKPTWQLFGHILLAATMYE